MKKRKYSGNVVSASQEYNDAKSGGRSFLGWIYETKCRIWDVFAKNSAAALSLNCNSNVNMPVVCRGAKQGCPLLFTLSLPFSPSHVLWLYGEAVKLDKHFGNCHPANQSSSTPLLLHFKGRTLSFVTFDPVGEERVAAKDPSGSSHPSGSEQRSVRLCAPDPLPYPTSVLHGPTVTGVVRSLNSSESESWVCCIAHTQTHSQTRRVSLLKRILIYNGVRSYAAPRFMSLQSLSQQEWVCESKSVPVIQIINCSVSRSSQSTFSHPLSQPASPLHTPNPPAN